MLVTLYHLDNANSKKSTFRRFLYDPVSKKYNTFKCVGAMISTFIVTTTALLSFLNLLLLTICNMSITNPGPDTSCIKLFYLNIQYFVHKHIHVVLTFRQSDASSSLQLI